MQQLHLLDYLYEVWQREHPADPKIAEFIVRGKAELDRNQAISQSYGTSGIGFTLQNGQQVLLSGGEQPVAAPNDRMITIPRSPYGQHGITNIASQPITGQQEQP